MSGDGLGERMDAASAHSLGGLTREGPFHSSFPCHPPTCLLTTTTELCPLACSPVHRRRRRRRSRLRLSTRCVAACRPRVRHRAPIGWQCAHPPRMQDSLWRRAPLARLGVREVILFNGHRARVVNTFNTHTLFPIRLFSDLRRLETPPEDAIP